MQVNQKQCVWWGGQKKKRSKSSYLSQLSKHKTWALCVSGALSRYEREDSDSKARFSTLSDWDELTLRATLTLMYKPNKKEEPLYRKRIKTFPARAPNPARACTDFPRRMLRLKLWKSGSAVKAWTRWTSYWVWSYGNPPAHDMWNALERHEMSDETRCFLI